MSSRGLAADAETIRSAARPADFAGEFDALLERADGASCVLIGEASHGTHEFYALRAELTRRLIGERGFRAVCWEGDWPDSFRVHRYVTGRTGDHSAEEALADFTRF